MTMTNQPCKKIHVMQFIAALQFGGAERLAVTISASLPRERFRSSVCALLGKEGPLVEDLRRHAIPHHYLDAGSGSKAMLAWNLFRLLRRERVDILQIHGAYTLLNCFLPAKLAGVKIVYTEHARQTISILRSARLAARYFSRGTALVVCVSENLRSFFQEVLKVPAARLQVIHNGIDTRRFRNNTPPFSGNGSHRVIGCIARLTQAKDHANLLKAFAIVAGRHKGVKLVLVGEGELREEIQRQIFELGLVGSVEMLGNRNDIPQLLSEMDIFVLPSRREGFPVSILEAMAAGRPVVATAVGGVAEVISSGVNGIMVPPEAPEALAASLLELLDDSSRAVELATRGMLSVRSNFSVICMMDQYEKMFELIYLS